MIKKYYYLFFCFFLIACNTDDITLDNLDTQKTQTRSFSVQNTNIRKGVMRIKLANSITDKIHFTQKSNLTQCNISQLNALFGGLRAKKVMRLFPYAGKFEERTRKEGLHRWYVVEFNDDIPMDKALSKAKSTRGVEIVESVPEIKLYGANTTSFNDPYLSRQWHYNNTGEVKFSKAGADINLYKAWEIETGKPNVIVNIVDGGVDYKHEDLKESFYINEAELNGEAGKDDDENGFVDDVYGYNFVDNKGLIEDSNPHATHVAGTVAARNNNGIGVCGVAGGDGTANSGVRIINSQIFKDGQSAGWGSSARAIKYGADNGAVISQNSWGYGNPEMQGHYIYPSDKEAIDYFIKYAGCDNNGNQLPDSPMKGGVLIFAGGNEAEEYLSYPAAYEKVIAVSAMRPDFKKAWYSNWGSWMDIMAPGGNDFGEQRIYSTVPNNSYDYNQGTSMACPHVSGVAALIVSKFGKQGFTNEDLKKRLLTALKDVNIDKENPKYKGKLGRGYLDAYKALAENKNKKPKKPITTSIKPELTAIELEWNAVSDEDDGTANVYNLYYAKNSLNTNNYKNANLIEVSGINYKAGEKITYLLEKLSLNTTYYFALEAIDRWGLTSGVYFTQGKTKENFPPIITKEEKVIRITGEETATLKLTIDEPEKQQWTYKIEGYQKGVSCKREGDTLLFTFRVIEPLGKYSFKVVVTDIFKANSEPMEVTFEYYKNEPPVLEKEFDKVFIPINKNYTINLLDYFTDPENKKMTFTANSSNNSLAGVKIEGNKLAINPINLGIGSINISATDIGGKKTTATLQFQAVNDAIVYLMYPIPVEKNLNIRLSNEVDKAKLIIRTITGKTVLEKNVTVVGNNRHIILNLSNFAAGNYVLIVEANGEKFEQTFVKY